MIEITVKISADSTPENMSNILQLLTTLKSEQPVLRAERIIAAGRAMPSAEDILPGARRDGADASDDLAEAAAVFGQQDLPLDPAAAPASTDASAGSAPAATSVELDSNGMPWDERIHGGARTKNKDGSWRYKKNVDEAFRKGIEADIRAAMKKDADEAPVPSTALSPAASDVHTAITGNVILPPPVAATAAPGVILPPPVDATPARASDGVAQFNRFVAEVMRAQGEKKITQDDVKNTSATLGLTSIRELAGKPELIAKFRTVLGI